MGAARDARGSKSEKNYARADLESRISISSTIARGAELREAFEERGQQYKSEENVFWDKAGRGR